VLRAGAFDMAFSGRHGGEDQDLGRRLAQLVDGSDRVFVHEPPFGWQPARNTAWDAVVDGNVCTDGHHVTADRIDGVPAHRCTRCPFYWVPDEALQRAGVRLPFDASRLTLESIPAGR
jgi:hypothetical protein